MKHRSLRNRLVTSFVLLAVGVLVLVAVIAVPLVQRGAQRAALHDVGHKADNIEANTADLRATLSTTVARPKLRLRDALDQLRSSVRVSDARLLFITPDGSIARLDDLPPLVAAQLRAGDPDVGALLTPPDGLPSERLDTNALLAGQRVTLRAGKQVYAAQPLTRVRRYELAVVIGENVDQDAARRAAFAIIVAGLVALGASIAVAVWLARRLTRPLGAIDATARRLADGDLTARVAVDRDTDAELAAVAATLNRMAADLDASRHAEQTFLQAVSHDLRTPLTSIRGYAEALADGTLDAGDEAARLRAASVITTEARRLERLVRDLLDLSRLDAHEFTLRPQPVDAASVVRETAEGFAPRAAEIGVVLAVAADAPIAADLDADRLGQVVANLVENALKYARGRVSVVATATADRVDVTVTDDGPGIPPDDQARVFERLATARASGGRAIGTGLGLAIARELTRAMGGDVRLLASDPTGSTFAASVARGTPPS